MNIIIRLCFMILLLFDSCLMLSYHEPGATLAVCSFDRQIDNIYITVNLAVPSHPLHFSWALGDTFSKDGLAWSIHEAEIIEDNCANAGKVLKSPDSSENNPFYLDTNHGLMKPTGSFNDSLLSLTGSNGILDHAIVVLEPNTSQVVDCCSIKLLFSVPIKADCSFGVGNSIRLEEDPTINGTLLSWENLSPIEPAYADNAIWEIHQNPVDNLQCSTTGDEYNPKLSGVPSSYKLSELWKNNQKLNTTGSFKDKYIRLIGETSIIGRSLVVEDPDENPLSCCTITQVPAKINPYQIAPRYNVDAIISALNDYRIMNSYPAIPISVALMTTGQWHANMILQYPETITDSCGVFSWPQPPIEGLWKPCCFLKEDGIGSTCIRYKPDEITSNWNNIFGNIVFFSSVKISEKVESPERVVVDAWLGDNKVKHCLLEKECLGKVWSSIGVGIASDEYSQVRAYLYLSTSLDHNEYTPFSTNFTLPDSDPEALSHATVENPIDPRSEMNNLIILILCIIAVILAIVIIGLILIICRDTSSSDTPYTEMEEGLE